MAYSITFEWHLADDDSEFWNRATYRGEQADSAAQEPAIIQFDETSPLMRALRVVAILFSVVLVAAGAGFTGSQSEQSRAFRGVQFTLDLEDKAWEVRDRALFHTLIDSRVPEDWVREWREHWTLGIDDPDAYQVTLLDVQPLETSGLVRASVQVRQPPLEWWHTNTYYEQRFYRESGQGWVRTLPPPAYWGSPRRLETEHMEFYYYEHDAAVVEELADDLEAGYVALYDLLDVEPADSRITIHVVTDQISRWGSYGNQIEITSPTLTKTPAGYDAVQYMTYRIMGRLTYLAVRDAVPGTASRYLYRWPVLIWGLRGWLRDDVIGTKQPWREDALAVFREYSRDRFPLRIGEVNDLRTDTKPERDLVVWRYMAAESLFDYTVERFGREKVPELLAGLVEYGSVSEMVPAVFDEPVESFVADWNDYLSREYGLSE
jgi:hypothetical protein